MILNNIPFFFQTHKAHVPAHIKNTEKIFFLFLIPITSFSSIHLNEQYDSTRSFNTYYLYILMVFHHVSPSLLLFILGQIRVDTSFESILFLSC